MSATSDQSNVSMSEELFAPLPNGVEICYQTFGDPGADPLLLVMGLGGPMNWWDTGLCTLLAEKDFFVIRYDNRDTGRSSRDPRRVRQGDVVRAFLGRPVDVPYSIVDLAEDAFGLLDHLRIESAHVVGASMGGMIAQTMAIARPDRVRSLTSIMSTTGRRTVGWQSPSLLPILAARRGPDREAYVAGGLRVWQMIGSPGFPPDLEELERRGHETYDRGVSRSGVLRQMMAVLTQTDRTAALRKLSMPALVIHGMADRMVHVSGGRSTAMAISGSELLLIDAMGHDFPKPLYDTIASAVRRTADRVTPKSD